MDKIDALFWFVLFLNTSQLVAVYSLGKYAKSIQDMAELNGKYIKILLKDLDEKEPYR